MLLGAWYCWLGPSGALFGARDCSNSSAAPALPAAPSDPRTIPLKPIRPTHSKDTTPNAASHGLLAFPRFLSARSHAPPRQSSRSWDQQNTIIASLGARTAPGRPWSQGSILLVVSLRQHHAMDVISV